MSVYADVGVFQEMCGVFDGPLRYSTHVLSKHVLLDYYINAYQQLDACDMQSFHRFVAVMYNRTYGEELHIDSNYLLKILGSEDFTELLIFIILLQYYLPQ